MKSKLGVDLPHRWAGNENWKDIEIDNGEVSYNAIGRPLYRQCSFELSRTWRDKPIDTNTLPIRCGGEAWYIVTRTSKLTGHTYTDYACLYHARQWINPNA